MDYLPVVGDRLRAGRNLSEGYQRGCGLEFGDLSEKISADPDYLDATEYCGARSVVRVDRLMNLFLLMKFFLPRIARGHIIEYGSYRGGSAFFLAALARKFLPGAQIYALDTFSGMPATDGGVDAHRQGDFSKTSFEELLRARSEHGLDNLHFVRGLFAETAPQVLRQAERIALAHIDCDIYESVRYAYDSCKDYFVSQGYIVFDDSTSSSCLGATEAVEKFVIQRDGLLSEQIFPHHVFRAPELRSEASVDFMGR
jgi:Macrocin-O-methyltransferase (TylF)